MRWWPMPARKSAKPDANKTAAELVRAVTDGEPVRGEDLIGDAETRRKFLEAKEREAKRKADAVRAS